MLIDYKVADGIAHITFNRPEKLNALSLKMYKMLGNAFCEAKDDNEVEVIILSGKGEKAFCVGADLTESIKALSDNRFDISEWDYAHLKHVKMYKPIICAVNGLCLGGGFEIILATDIRIASSTAEFGFPEASIGFVPAGGTLVRLSRQIPFAYAMEILLTGKRFSAQDLAGMGVINKVVEPKMLETTAVSYARLIMEQSPLAIQTIKESVMTLREMTLDEAFVQEARLGQRTFTSADAKEGLQSFIEKRKPIFPSSMKKTKKPIVIKAMGKTYTIE
jgi:enoyl-CoA hydratase/carnithine racemase